MQKKTTFQTTLYNVHENLWSFHIKVPAELAVPYIDKDRRIICQLNDIQPFACALMPDGDGHFFISVNKERRKQLDIAIGDEVTVIIQKDTSKYGMPMPEVMAELLAQDPVADKYFHALTAGKQRSLLHIIAKPKTEATRLKKAVVITEYLKTNKGQLDFQELQMAFKEYGR